MTFYYILYYFLLWLLIISLVISSVYIRLISLYILSLIYIFSLIIIFLYNKSIMWYQVIFRFYNIDLYNINNIIGLDGISIFFILLCVFLLLNCLLGYWYLRYKITLYCGLLIFVLWLLINLFSSLDMLLFYIYFEGIAIPMFLLIGIWGSRSRKIYAAYQFFIYTLLGSIFVLIVIISVLFNKGTTLIDLYLN